MLMRTFLDVLGASIHIFSLLLQLDHWIVSGMRWTTRVQFRCLGSMTEIVPKQIGVLRLISGSLGTQDLGTMRLGDR